MPKGSPVRPAVNPRTKSKIPIPDDIYVEEQYEDILKIVNRLLPLFEGVKFDNHNPAGRLHGALLFLRQEVESKRFPIPGTRDMVGTVGYLAANSEFLGEREHIKRDLYDIISIVECDGLLKSRHYPRLIELINALKIQVEKVLLKDASISRKEQKNMDGLLIEIKKIGRLLMKGENILPLKKEDWPFYWDKMTRGDVWDKHDDLYQCERNLSGPLTSNWRPRQSQPTLGWEMPDWVKDSSE